MGIIRLVIFGALIYFGYKFIKSLFLPPGHHAGGTGPGPGVADEGEAMVLDPVCNTYIPASNAVSIRKGGEVLHFCGDECKEKYIASLKG